MSNLSGSRIVVLLVALAGRCALAQVLLHNPKDNVTDTDAPYPQIEVMANVKGQNVLFMQTIYRDQVVELPVDTLWITLQCTAPYPVEWDLVGRFTPTYEGPGLRSWITENRFVDNLWNSSTFKFYSTLMFFEIGGRLATAVLANVHGGSFWIYSNKTTLHEESGLGDLRSNSGLAPECNFTVIYSDHLQTICCQGKWGDLKLEHMPCFNPAECRNLYERGKRGCVRQMYSKPVAGTGPTGSRCLNSSELLSSPGGGVVSCGSAYGDSEIVSVQYITSVPNLCSYGQGQIEKLSLHVHVGGRPANLQADLLLFCPLKYPKMYIGEEIQLKCLGSTLFFSYGFHFVLKRKYSAGLVAEELIGSASNERFDDRDKDLMYSTRILSYTIRLNDTSLFEVVCAAPSRDSFGWINRTVGLSVIGATPIEFLDEDVQEVIIDSAIDTPVTCEATGDPPPRLTWQNTTEDMVIVSNNRTSKIELKVKGIGGWNPPIRDSYILHCEGRQDRIGSRRMKAFRLKKPTDRRILLTYVAAIVGPIAGLFLIGLGILAVLVWRMRDRWRNLNPDEVDEFFNGNKADDAEGAETNSNYVNAWNRKYDFDFEIPAKELRMGPLIAKGEFGRVHSGSLKRRTPNFESLAVVIKKNIPFLTSLDFKASLYELKLLIHLGDHPNIVKLHAAVTANVRKREVLVVLEYCLFGDLKSYLYKNRGQIVGRAANVPQSMAAQTRGYVSADELLLANIDEMGLLRWTRQVLNGVIFLGSKGVIHGDLAARNVLLDAALTAKICDFGMSHQVAGQGHPYMVSPHVRRPWFSAAPESLERCEYSIKSDVYGFGVFLWELFTLGDDPWTDVRREDMLTILKGGECLSMPRVRNWDGTSQGSNGIEFEITLATAGIYDRMKHCQQYEPQNRPGFEELWEYFEGLATVTN